MKLFFLKNSQSVEPHQTLLAFVSNCTGTQWPGVAITAKNEKPAISNYKYVKYGSMAVGSGLHLNP
jgi:hypothetical protein